MKHVAGEMIVRWTVQLPDDATPVACDDPAVESAMQAVCQEQSVYLWGTDKRPAFVYAEVGEDDVRVEEDDRDMRGQK